MARQAKTQRKTFIGCGSSFAKATEDRCEARPPVADKFRLSSYVQRNNYKTSPRQAGGKFLTAPLLYFPFSWRSQAEGFFSFSITNGTRRVLTLGI